MDPATSDRRIGHTINRRQWVAGAAGVLASALLPARASSAAASNTMPSVQEVAHDPAIPALGNPQGDLTIVEFVDYQCPYCKHCYFEIQELVSSDPGIRLVIKDWPIFGGASDFAARALLASSVEPAYARAVDALMGNERKLTVQRVSDLLEGAGIDPSALAGRMRAGQEVVDGILARNAAHATTFGLQGTPAVMVGKMLYRRGLRLDELRTAAATARTQPALSAT